MRKIERYGRKEETERISDNYWKEGKKKYTVKKGNDFPVSSRDVINKTFPDGEKFNNSQPGRVRLVTSQLGTGKSLTFFYSIYRDHEEKKRKRYVEKKKKNRRQQK
jgi:hypothetical protein